MRRRASISALSLLLPLGAASCLGIVDLSEEVILSVQDPQIELINGDRVAMSVDVTISNNTSRPLAYDTCAAGFERLTAEGWRSAAYKACNSRHRRWVDPGASPLERWHNNQPIDFRTDPPFEGQYRFVARITDTDLESHTIISDVFDIDHVLVR